MPSVTLRGRKGGGARQRGRRKRGRRRRRSGSGEQNKTTKTITGGTIATEHARSLVRGRLADTREIAARTDSLEPGHPPRGTGGRTTTPSARGSVRETAGVGKTTHDGTALAPSGVESDCRPLQPAVCITSYVSFLGLSVLNLQCSCPCRIRCGCTWNRASFDVIDGPSCALAHGNRSFAQRERSSAKDALRTRIPAFDGRAAPFNVHLRACHHPEHRR